MKNLTVILIALVLVLGSCARITTKRCPAYSGTGQNFNRTKRSKQVHPWSLTTKRDMKNKFRK